MGEGSSEDRSSAPLLYWVACPGSSELLVGAKIFLGGWVLEFAILLALWRVDGKVLGGVRVVADPIVLAILFENAGDDLISMDGVVSKFCFRIIDSETRQQSTLR